MTLSEAFHREAQSLGLVVSALVPSKQFQSYFPTSTRALFLLGSSGERFFAAFESSNKAGIDPLDTFTRDVVTRLVHQFVPGALGVYFPFEAPFLPFIQLAKAAGLGHVGPLGILVNERHGPWFALRACVALPEEVLAPVVAPDVCATCSAPCVSACPAGAARREGFVVERCGAARKGGPCGERCIAREACPVGVSWRYSEGAIRFHHRAASLFF